MPIYAYRIDVPQKITERGEVREEIEIEGEMLRKVSVLIPFGHKALTGLRIRYGAKPLVPFHVEGWLQGDGETLEFDVMWPLPESPCTLIVEAYNEDMCYDHSFYLRLVTDSEETHVPEKELISFWQKLAYMMGLPVGVKSKSP